MNGKKIEKTLDKFIKKVGSENMYVALNEYTICYDLDGDVLVKGNFGEYDADGKTLLWYENFKMLINKHTSKEFIKGWFYSIYDQYLSK